LPFQAERVANQDSALARMSPNGTDLTYSSYLGGSGNDYAYGLALDTDGVAYAAGQTNSSDFPTVGALQPSKGAGTTSDAFVVRVTTPLDFFVASISQGVGTVRVIR
jgi:hypothetical protein